jgi:mannose-6-phosphate isomerase-like protein (cupin superfamily)
MEKIEKVSLREAAEKVDGYWNPLIVGELNSQCIKLAKFKGEFDWHHHEQEDEAFLVVKGIIQIHFRDRTVELNEGELIVVPRGVEHKPAALEEAHVLLFEPGSTLNTGNVVTEKTRSELRRYSS